MLDKWQAPDRDSPSIQLDYGVKMTDQLKALLSMEGHDGYNEEAVKRRTGQDVSRPRRWHLMFERMGLLYRIKDQTHLTDLGRSLLDASRSDPRMDLARQALATLSRYQLKNPVDEESDTYPDDCDIHPYWAIWKACDELDGKLHWDELNREIMRVLRHADLGAAIEKIRLSRTQPGYDPVNGGSKALPLSDRCYDNDAPPEGRSGEGQVRDQRTTPWFKRASLGEHLLSSPGAQGNGYWTVRPEFRQLLHDWIGLGPPPFRQMISKEQWYRYLSGQDAAVQQVDISGLMDVFSADTRIAGLVFPPHQLWRLVASLLSKRFLILTGLAGSGKTKLAQALAHWLSPPPELAGPSGPSMGQNVNSNCSLVPVGADWTGNENILGYPNGLDEKTYITKPALELILHASANKNSPHFLILDEMNLSHVERYFADLLSMIESEGQISLYCDSKDATGKPAKTRGVDPVLQLPPNLFIIGTVNVDETTYMFSPKVLDRANVIEFRLKDSDLASFLDNPIRPNLPALWGKGAQYGVDFVKAANGSAAVPAEIKSVFDSELLLFFKVLQEHGAEFGYRTAHEASRFLHFFKLLGNQSEEDTFWFHKAFDCIVLQKLLPKLHGSRSKLSPLLRKLWFLCVTESAARGDDAHAAALKAASTNNKDAEPNVEPPAGAPYPLSAEKIGRMWSLLSENGFASFAEA